MSSNLNIPAQGELDLLSLGAIIHRLDSGRVPFRKAHTLSVHVSGGGAAVGRRSRTGCGSNVNTIAGPFTSPAFTKSRSTSRACP